MKRRSFLKASLTGVPGLALSSSVFSTVLDALIRNSIAKAMGVGPKMNYVHFSFPGAPPRWLFDLPLRPNGNDAFQAGSFGNYLSVSAGQTGFEYRSTPFQSGGRTLHVPHLWSLPGATSKSGGKADLKQILNHSLFIRGVNMEIDGHGLNNGRQTAPAIGSHSITGMIADKTDLPLAAVGANATAATAFRSKTGGSQVTFNIGAANPIATLMDPFRPLASSVGGRNAANVSSLVEQSFQQFDQYARRHGIGRASMGQALNSADKLIKQGLDDVNSSWTSLSTKYRSIIGNALRAANGTLPGINNIVLSNAAGGQNNEYTIDNAGTSGYTKTADLRSSITSNTHINTMASAFSVVEYLIVNDLSPSIVIGIPNLGSITVQDLFNAQNQAISNSTRTLTHDQHRYGVVPTIYYNTLFYNAFASCMFELIESLKAAGKFDQTLIHIGSEFNRSPRNDKIGSDHGWMGNNVSIISGQIDRLSIIGNISRSGINNYDGTWGVGANWQFPNENRNLRIQDVSNSICSCLGVDMVSANGIPIFSSIQGRISPTKEEAKNV